MIVRPPQPILRTAIDVSKFALTAAILAGSVWLSWIIFASFWKEPIWNPLSRWGGAAIKTLAPARLGPLEAEVVGGQFLGECGGAMYILRMYILSDKVAQEIEKQGPAFFDDAPRRTGSPDDRSASGVVRPETWRETPLPASTYSEGSWSVGFDCMNLQRDLEEAVDHAVRRKGGFYLQGSRSKIVVLPASRLVIVTYDE